MLITSIAYGTRGDVQPALALARRLKADGHTVRMVVASNFTDMVERHGLTAVPADVDIKELLKTAGGLDLIESGKKVSFPRSVRTMRRLFTEHGPAMIDNAYRACVDADLILSAFLSNVLAVSIREKLGVRHISTMVTPSAVATRSGAATLGAPRPGGESVANYLLQKAVIERVDWSLTRDPVDRFRRETLGLPPLTLGDYLRRLRSTPVLHGISPSVMPHPGDWPGTMHTTGYWFLPEDPDWEPKPELLDFLDAGEPPVFLTFGSMTGRDPRATTRLLLDAVVRSGRRAILQSGWAGLGEADLPKNVHLLDLAPYGQLLPRVGALVHHAGAGSTAEGLRAGLPTVAIPHMGDQPYWGTRIHQLGVGPRPIPRTKLTVENLASAIREATDDPEMRRRATALGAKIRSEDGLSTASRLINDYVSAS